MEGQTNLNLFIENDIRIFWRKEFELFKSLDFFNEVFSVYDVKPTDFNENLRTEYDLQLDKIFTQENDFWKKIFKIFDINISWNKNISSTKLEYIKATEKHFKKTLLEKTITFKIFFRLYLDIFVIGNHEVSNIRKMRFIFDVESNKDKIKLILEENLKNAIKNPEYSIISSKKRKIENEISEILSKDEFDNFDFIKLDETRSFFEKFSKNDLEKFNELSRTLLPREKKIVYSFLGIGEVPKSFSVISLDFFTTEKKISNVFEKALRKLNSQIRLENDFFDF